MRYAGFVTALSFAMLVSCSNGPRWGTEWDALIEKPGTKVIIGKTKDGADTREIRLPSGVSRFETRRGNEVSGLSFDRSGHGAVLCLWGIYVSLKSAMEICPTAAEAEFKREVDVAVDRINGFIVENSLSPVTKVQLEDRIEKRTQSARSKMEKMKKQQPSACLNREIASILKHFESKPREKFRKGIDDLLSVARPPVMNPCL